MPALPMEAVSLRGLFLMMYNGAVAYLRKLDR